MFVADAECGRSERNLFVHARRRPLAVERHVRAAHQRRHDPLRIRLLNLGDGRAEIGNIKREEICRSDCAFAQLDVMRQPFCRDLAVVIVSREDINLVAPFFHGVIDDRLDCLRRRRTGHHNVAIANTAFVQHVVEIKCVAALEGLANRFARRGGDAAVYHVHFIVAA